MSNDEVPDLDPMPTIVLEAGSSGAMKMTVSISDGTHVWLAITPEQWEDHKRRGDFIMAETLRITAEENPNPGPE